MCGKLNIFFRTVVIHRMFVVPEKFGGSQATSCFNWRRLDCPDVKV